jgi:hypothetical protein
MDSETKRAEGKKPVQLVKIHAYWATAKATTVVSE